MHFLTSLIFLDMPLIYYYFNLRLSVIFYLSSGNIYIFLQESFLSYLFVTVSELFCCDVFDIFVVLSAILLPIKSLVACFVFWIAFFEALF